MGIKFVLQFALCAALQVVAHAVDWAGFLQRHDPVWETNVTCSVGYTQLNETIKSGGCSCTGPVCTSAATCVEETARVADTCPDCTSFGISPAWHNGLLAQMYGNSTPYINNPQWTTWVKGGPELRNHSSCSGLFATAWEDGLFFGDGVQGGILRFDPASARTTMRIDLGRVDIWDRRTVNSTYAVGNILFDRPRLPVGHLQLNTTAPITSLSMRLHLYNASITGTLVTSAGSLSFMLYAHYTRGVMLMRYQVAGGEGFTVTLLPDQGDSTRHTPPANYRGNPPFSCAVDAANGINTCTQPLLVGGDYATAVRTTAMADGSTLVAVSIANDWPLPGSGNTAHDTVLTQGNAAVADWDSVFAEHAAAWAGIYPSGAFLSIPDTELEGMYAIQVYKLHCFMREGGWPVDLMGPFFQTSGWNAWWLDLNVQLAWWPLYASGRFALSSTFVGWLSAITPTLYANAAPLNDTAFFSVAVPYDGAMVPQTVYEGSIVGDLVWTCHNLYLHARYTRNATMMTDMLFPLLKASIRIYEPLSFNGSDGYIHLAATASPEYPYSNGTKPDCNFDLALWRWGAQTLLDIAAQYNLTDADAPRWQDVVQRLTPPPTDPALGLMVAAGQEFDVPHRHFSHLFSIYPLHLTNYEDADGGSNYSRWLIAASLDHWNGLTCPDGVCPNGFTFDGSSSISALMSSAGDGRRAAAVGNLTGFVRAGLMHASTLYSEGHQPCSESPLAAANSLQEVLLQSWGGRLRVFPAVPDAWSDAVIADMAAEDGLLVTAVRTNGTTQFVSVTATDIGRQWAHTPAQADAPVQVRLASNMGQSLSTIPPGVPLSFSSNGDVSFSLAVNSTVTLYPAGSQPDLNIAPLPGNASQYNCWGLHPGSV